MKKNATRTAKNNFSHVVHANINRSTFVIPSRLVTTMNAGDITPVMIQEVLPGDTFNLDIAMVGRTITPITPVMDLCYFNEGP